MQASAPEPGAEKPLPVAGHTSHQYEFPRRRRLNQSANYRRVFAGNYSVANQHFVLLGRHNDGNTPRLGLAIAKKHLKRAADRNLAKRIVRESFRLQQNVLNCIDIVVMVKRGIQLCDKTALRRDLDALWLRLNRKCKML